MADALPADRGYRTKPRQGMTRWSVIRDTDGRPEVVAEFHGYAQARAESDRLNAAASELRLDRAAKVSA